MSFVFSGRWASKKPQQHFVRHSEDEGVPGRSWNANGPHVQVGHKMLSPGLCLCRHPPGCFTLLVPISLWPRLFCLYLVSSLWQPCGSSLVLWSRFVYMQMRTLWVCMCENRMVETFRQRRHTCAECWFRHFISTCSNVASICHLSCTFLFRLWSQTSARFLAVAHYDPLASHTNLKPANIQPPQKHTQVTDARDIWPPDAWNH